MSVLANLPKIKEQARLRTRTTATPGVARCDEVFDDHRTTPNHATTTMSCSRRCSNPCGRTCPPPCSCSVSNSLGTDLTTLTLTGAGDAVAINDAPLTLYIPCTSNVSVTFSGSLYGTEDSPAQSLGVQLSATNNLSLYTPATTLEAVCPRAYVDSVNPIPISITTIFTLVPGTYSFSTLLFNETVGGETGTYGVRGNLTVLAVKTSNTLL